MIALVAHCRAGFEREAAQDLERIAASARASATLDAADRRGFVVATLDQVDLDVLASALRRAAPIFVRSLFAGLGPVRWAEPQSGVRSDRVTALLALLDPLTRALPSSLRAPYGELRIEMPDTNEGKALSTLGRAIEPRLRDGLVERSMLTAADPARPTLHVLLAQGSLGYAGASAAPWRSAWPMGIARLRMPRGAPSRSTLKLAEALQSFLGADEALLVRPGMKAVDLGAAPGGWSFLLARRGLRVRAVDNGPLKGEAARDPLVTHVREDGLAYRPRRPVDWMTCDIVEQPSRIAAVVARWIAHGDARRTIFNLKLPMKRRYDEVLRCESIVRDALARAKVRHALSLRQLYHDREEVTGYCARLD